MEERHADVVKKLRAELEAERHRNKQILREKVVELRQLKQEAAHDKERAVELASKKLQADKASELKMLRDSLLRQKEQELRHVVKYKDEETKQIREQLVKEKASAVRHAAAEARKEAMDSIHDQIAFDKAKLLDEVWVLREQKLKLEEEVKLRRDGERQANESLRRTRQELEAEKEQLLKQSRMEATRDYQQLRLAERVVQQKEQEAMMYQHHARMLEVEKETLGEELSRRKEAESWEKRSNRSRNDSMNDSLGDGVTPMANKRIYDDKEKELLQKVSRLSSHIRVLEERNASLKSECSSLKQQSHNDKTDVGERQNKQLEDKVKKLRQRNRELVTLARRLEEEKKALKDNLDVSTSPSSSGKELDAYKKSVAREKAKNQAEHARQLLALKKEVEALTEKLVNKEQEINALNANLQQAIEKAQTTQVAATLDETNRLRTEIESLEMAMKATAKEKLQFEKLLAENPTHAVQLQELRSELGVLHQAQGALVEKLGKKDEELSALQEKMVEMKEAEEDMEKKLQQLFDENSTLAADLGACTTARGEMEQKITELEQQIGHLDKVQAHCNELEGQLHEAEESLASARQENEDLQAVAEEARAQIHHAEQQKVNVELELAAAHAQIEERDTKILSLTEMLEKRAMTDIGSDTVENLQSRVHELEQECAEKELQCITLQDRMEKLCEAGINFDSSFTSSLNDAGVLLDPGTSLNHRQPDGEERQQEKQSVLVSRTSTDAIISALEDSGSDAECMSGRTSSLSGFDLRQESIGDESSSKAIPQEMPSKPRVAMNTVLVGSSLSDTLGSLKDEFMAVGETVESDYDTYSSDEDEEESRVGRKNSRRNGDVRSPDSEVSSKGEVMPLSHNGRDHDTSEVSLATEASDNQAKGDRQDFHYENVLEQLNSEEETSNEPAQLSLDKAFVASPSSQGSSQWKEGGGSGGSSMAVFVAKFDYNPETDSPNDNPGTELAITTGEYIYVYGDMDEDGFYVGEKEDGQKGLVPSNFVERVVDDTIDVDERAPEDSSSQTTPTVDEDEIPEELAGLVPMATGYNQTRELETVEEEDEDQVNESVDSVSKAIVAESSMNESVENSLTIPAPRELKVEREFARSLLVSWEPPEGIVTGEIQGYNVYVGNTLKTLVKGNNKHRALLEGLDFYSGRFTVSVKTVTAKGESADPKNCLVLGKDPVHPPKDVQLQLSTDGSRSLHVTWTPVDPSDSLDSIPTGYKVYIDGVSASHVSGADSSSAYINQFTISTLYTAEPHKVYVKTVSGDGESAESDTVTFTSDLLAGSSDSSTEEHIDELRDSGVYSRGEQRPRASTEEKKIVESCSLPSEQNANSEGEDVDTIVQSVKAEISQQQQRKAEVLNAAASQLPVTGEMFTIAGEAGESVTESSSTTESDSEGETLEVFASPDKSEASASKDDELSEGEIRGPVQQVEQITTKVKVVDLKPRPPVISSIRKFVALFDYDPATMSPNDDGAEEELSFRKGDVIKVYGDKDEDGFYLGEVDGRQGFVPYNMITELVTETVCNGYPEASQEDVLSPDKAVAYDSVASEDFESALPMHDKMIALFDYNPQEHSPNADSEVELPLRAGDIIYVLGEVDDDGFFQGETEKGDRGLVPSNYLRPESEHNSYHLRSPDDPSGPQKDFIVHRDVDSDKPVVSSEQPKKKKSLLSKGKNFVKRLGKSRQK